MKNILIVEDDHTVCKLLKTALQQEGYQVMLAFDVNGAKGAIVREHLDLIILDLTLPGGSGIEIAEFITIRPQSSNVPIIITSARIDDEAKAACANLGVISYFEKPYTCDQVLLTVKDLFKDTVRS